MQQFESFAQMQRDAAMRVMEMQKRAQAAMKNTSTPSGMPVPAPYADSDPLCDSDPLREPEQPTSPDNTPPPEKPEAPQHGLSDEESERALVTAILLLLMREKADERLLFALLYILI